MAKLLNTFVSLLSLGCVVCNVVHFVQHRSSVPPDAPFPLQFGIDGTPGSASLPAYVGFPLFTLLSVFIWGALQWGRDASERHYTIPFVGPHNRQVQVAHARTLITLVQLHVVPLVLYVQVDAVDVARGLATSSCGPCITAVVASLGLTIVVYLLRAYYDMDLQVQR